MIFVEATAFHAIFEAWENDDKVLALYLYRNERLSAIDIRRDCIRIKVRNSAGFRLRLHEHYAIDVAANELTRIDRSCTTTGWPIPEEYKHLGLLGTSDEYYSSDCSLEPYSPITDVSIPDEFPDDEELLRRYNEQREPSSDEDDEIEDYYAPKTNKWM